MKLMLNTDGYKVDHRRQYVPGTEVVYANFTPRNGRLPGFTGVVATGLQPWLQRNLIDAAKEFFETPKAIIVAEYQKFLDSYLGPNEIGTDHISALHDLGYIPLEFKAVPEGTFVPYGVPVLTVENTLPEFFWLTNYFETLLSAELWQPMTSATMARQYRIILEKWAGLTSDTPEFVDWQGHDFSFRGMTSVESAAASGAGHLLYFTGTDTIPAIPYLEKYYDATGLIGGSVAATEHSVMCAGGEEGERETILRLLNLYKGGILSVVSDTWDLWKVLTEIAPSLKDEILAFNGKLVFRPDSGDPVKILVGNPDAEEGSPEFKGVVQILWEQFGGSVNSLGYKTLDPHVGAIYGDSITLERCEAICAGLATNGFASTNVVFGIGSFTYQYATRDTHGFAMKATGVVINGEERLIFKRPVTDNGGKFSAKGWLSVEEVDGRLAVIDNLSRAEAAERPSLLQPVFRDGEFIRRQTLDDIRQRCREGLLDS